MNKSPLQKVLKTDTHYSTDLVSLDFKSESLNKFLQNVVSIVNQHSHKLNNLQTSKITHQQILQSNISLFNSSKLSPNLIQELPVIKINQKNQTNKDLIEGFGAHLTQYSHAFQYLQDLNKKQNAKIDQLSGNLATFQTIDNTKQMLKKAQQQNKKFTEDQIARLNTRFKDLQMNTNKKLNAFENLTKQIQKKTLWKITQCQQGLMKKITAQYVQKALQQHQSKILFKIQQQKSQSLSQLKYTVQSLKQKLQFLTKSYQQSQIQTKKSIKQLNQQTSQFQSKQKLSKDFLLVQTKFKEMLIKIDKLEKREHPQELEMRILKVTTEHHQKINAQQEKIKKLDIQLSSINNVLQSMGTGGSGGDPHKLCQLDGEIRKLRDASRTNQGKIHSIQDQLKTKLLVFEQRIMTTLSMIKGQDHFVSRQQLYESISRLRQPLHARQSQNQTLISQLNAKMTKLQMFQKSTKKKIKQMTRGDQLNKILELKINTSQAQGHFNGMNMKLQALQIVMNKIKMEMESNSQFLRILQKQINQPEEGFNILGPKSKVFPAKCLGCGTKHIPTYQNNMMQGSDGKLYKVDMKNYPSDARQVYSVTQNQIAIFESPIKSTLKTRPTSGKTLTVRPSSSKYI